MIRAQLLGVQDISGVRPLRCVSLLRSFPERGALLGGVAGEGSLVGQIQAVLAAQGVAAGQGAVSGAVAAALGVAGAGAGVGAIAGAIQASLAAAGIAAGTGATTAAAAALLNLAGSAVGLGSASGAVAASAWYPPGAAFALQLDSPRDRYLVGGVEYFSFASMLSGSGSAFSRATTGTYIPAAGDISSVAIDIARRGDRGLLIEPTATNLAVQSNAFGTSPWTNSGTATVTANSTAAPNGVVEADTITFGASAADQRYVAGSLTAASHVISVFEKAAIGTKQSRLKYYPGSGADAYSSDFTGTTTWQRFEFPFTGSAASNGNYAIVNNSGGAAGSIICWGAQVELGSVATSPIPTNGSAVTRAADVFTLAVANGNYDVTFTFDDGTTQVVNGVSVSGGVGYTVPTNLSKRYIKDIVGVAA